MKIKKIITAAAVVPAFVVPPLATLTSCFEKQTEQKCSIFFDDREYLYGGDKEVAVGAQLQATLVPKAGQELDRLIIKTADGTTLQRHTDFEFSQESGEYLLTIFKVSASLSIIPVSKTPEPTEMCSINFFSLNNEFAYSGDQEVTKGQALNGAKIYPTASKPIDHIDIQYADGTPLEEGRDYNYTLKGTYYELNIFKVEQSLAIVPSSSSSAEVCLINFFAPNNDYIYDGDKQVEKGEQDFKFKLYPKTSDTLGELKIRTSSGEAYVKGVDFTCTWIPAEVGYYDVTIKVAITENLLILPFAQTEVQTNVIASKDNDACYPESSDSQGVAHDAYFEFFYIGKSVISNYIDIEISFDHGQFPMLDGNVVIKNPDDCQIITNRFSTLAIGWRNGFNPTDLGTNFPSIYTLPVNVEFTYKKEDQTPQTDIIPISLSLCKNQHSNILEPKNVSDSIVAFGDYGEYNVVLNDDRLKNVGNNFVVDATIGDSDDGNFLELESSSVIATFNQDNKANFTFKVRPKEEPETSRYYNFAMYFTYYNGVKQQYLKYNANFSLFYNREKTIVFADDESTKIQKIYTEPDPEGHDEKTHTFNFDLSGFNAEELEGLTIAAHMEVPDTYTNKFDPIDDMFVVSATIDKTNNKASVTISTKGDYKTDVIYDFQYNLVIRLTNSSIPFSQDFTFNGFEWNSGTTLIRACMSISKNSKGQQVISNVTRAGHEDEFDKASVFILPSDVEIISNDAFDADNSEHARFGTSNIKQVILDASTAIGGLETRLKQIGDKAFHKLTKLEAPIRLPASLTSELGQYCFARTNICSLTFENAGDKKCKLTEIPPYAFYECHELAGDIVLPESITKIKGHAFDRTDKIERIIGLKDMNLTISDKDSQQFQFGIEDDTHPSALTHIDGLPNGDFLPRRLFCGRWSLQGELDEYGNPTNCLSIKNKTIGDCCFDGCKSVKAIKLTEKTTTIGDHAFRNWISLECVDCTAIKNWTTTLSGKSTSFTNIPTTGVIKFNKTIRQAEVDAYLAQLKKLGFPTTTWTVEYVDQ